MVEEARILTRSTSNMDCENREKPTRDYRIYESGHRPVIENPDLPRVLLIGDSISEGYTHPVRVALAGTANVLRIPGNARNTRDGLQHLAQWLADTPWDVIHFNFGLHDISRTQLVNGVKKPSDQPRVPPEEYEANLRELVERLRATGAKLIWASTTRVPSRPPGAGRRNSDVTRYNPIAERVMRENGIVIIDLYDLSQQKLRDSQRTGPADVHFSDEGYGVLGAQVATGILDALRKKGSG